MARAVLVASVAAILATSSAAGAQAPTPALPDGPGAAVAKAACVGCHELDLIVSQRLSTGGWDREIAKMERWGARVSADDRALLLRYLARQFGLRPAVSHDAQAVAGGKAVFKTACITCHEDDLSAQQRLPAAAWGRTIDKMVRWGAKVSADDRGPLVAYLAFRWGPP